MSGSVLTYHPSSVTIGISGFIVPGLVSIALQWKSEVFTPVKGIRGIHTRVYNQDRHATLVLELLPTSIANDVFSDIVLKDSLYKTGRLEVVLKDTCGTSRFTTTDAYIKTFPELAFNAEGITTRKWEVDILSFVANSGNVGGNATNGIDITDILSGAGDFARSAINDGFTTAANYLN